MNKSYALEILTARLAERERNGYNNSRAAERKAQVGSGMRGDKRRTIRQQDDQVHDHITGKRWKYKDYIRGNWD
jgi:peptide chain release factor 1